MASEQPSLGIFTTDAQMNIRTWDEWLTRISRFSLSEVEGQPLAAIIPDLAGRGLEQRFQRVIQEGVVEILATSFHHFLIPCPPDQPSKFFDRMQQQVTIAPLKQEEKIIGTLVTVEDVTARMERDRELAEALSGPDEVKRLEAARTLAQAGEKTNTLLNSLSDESWRIRRVAVSGLARHGDQEAITSLLKTLRREHRDLSTLNSALQVLQFSNIDVLPSLIELLLDRDPEVRLYAAQALGDRGDPRAVPTLMALLKDQDPNVQYHAIEALGKLQAPEAVDPLLSIVESHNFFLAFPALEALKEIPDPRIAPRMVPFLKDELLRSPAAEILGQLGDEEVLAPLVELLNTPQAPGADIARALFALYERYQNRYGEGDFIVDRFRRMINPGGSQNLLKALSEAEEEGIRPLAVVCGWLEGPAVERALTRIVGHPQASKEVVEALVRYGQRVTDLLIEQLQAEDLEIRQAAVIALGRIGDPRSVQPLIQILTGDPELTVMAAGALAKIGDRRAFETLLGLMGHPLVAVRQAVISALNSIGHPRMAERVTLLLKDPDPLVRESAVRIAGYFGYSGSQDLLLQCCQDPVEAVRKAAIENLAYFEEPRVPAILSRALKEDTPRVRASAAKALAHIERDLAWPILLKALKDEEAWVRYFATRSLAYHRYPEACPVLAALAEQDPAQQVRIAALENIGQFDDEKAVMILTPLIDSPDPDFSRAAIRGLGSIQHPAALIPLVRVLRDPDPAKRLEAVLALGGRGGEGVAETLQWTAAAEPEDGIIQAALEALGRLTSSEGVSALINLTVDPRLKERCQEVLAGMKEESIEWIAHGLNHPHPRVRQTVIEVLARLKRPRASEWIIKTLEDRDPEVRATAALTLGNLSAYQARVKISALAAEDPDERVRRAALRALRK